MRSAEGLEKLVPKYLHIRGEVCDSFLVSCFLQLKIHPPEQNLLRRQAHQFLYILKIQATKNKLHLVLEQLHYAGKYRSMVREIFSPYYHQPTPLVEVFSLD